MSDNPDRSFRGKLAAINAACGAIQHMAIDMATVGILIGCIKPDPTGTLEKMTADSHDRLDQILTALDHIMQNVGDVLSNCDAVDELAEVATSGAFRIVRSVIDNAPIQEE